MLDFQEVNACNGITGCIVYATRTAVPCLVPEMLMIRTQGLPVYWSGEVVGSVIVLAWLSLCSPAAVLIARWPCELTVAVGLGAPHLSRSGLWAKLSRRPELGRGRLPQVARLRLILRTLGLPEGGLRLLI